MLRIWIIGIALAPALAMPATAQQRPVPQILERLHALFAIRTTSPHVSSLDLLSQGFSQG
jgi:hypothetical protein